MASRTTHSTTRTGRFTLIFIIILASALACRLRVLSTVLVAEPFKMAVAAAAAAAAPTGTKSTFRAVPSKYPRAEGRWKVVRASLGLPPVSDRIRVAVSAAAAAAPAEDVSVSKNSVASRFDLRRKRSMEDRESRTIPLYFSPDALERRTISLEEFSHYFRTVSPTSKQDEMAREQLDDTGKELVFAS